MAHRVDPDFDPTDDDIERAAVLLAKTLVRTPLPLFPTRNGNGFQKWILGIVALLVVMAVGEGVVMYGEITRMQATMIYMQDQIQDIKKLIQARNRNN